MSITSLVNRPAHAGFFMELNHYLEIARLYQIPLRPPPPNIFREKDILRWLEKRALEQVFLFSGIAYLALAEILRVDGNNIKTQMQKRLPKEQKVIYMESAIDARRSAIVALLSGGDGLTNLGLTGLGLLRTICCDSIAPAVHKLAILSVLAKHDPAGIELFNHYPALFDGSLNVCEYLKDDLMPELNWRDLRRKL